VYKDNTNMCKYSIVPPPYDMSRYRIRLYIWTGIPT